VGERSRMWGSAGLLTWALILGGALFLVGCDSTSPSSTATPPRSSSTTTAIATLPVTAILPIEATTTGDEGIVNAATVTPVPSPVGLDEDALAGVYTSVILEMLDKEGKEVGYVYVSPYIGQGEHLDNPDEDTPIPQELLPTLKRADSTNNRTYAARDFAEVVGPFDDGGKVENGGVFITLGPIENDAGKSADVTVRASIYRDKVSAEGNIYTLSKDAASDAGWKVVTTVPEWDSDNQ
jgi:hypothetical protein